MPYGSSLATFQWAGVGLFLYSLMTMASRRAPLLVLVGDMEIWPLEYSVNSYTNHIHIYQCPVDTMETLQIYKSTNLHIPPFISTPLHSYAMIFTI